MELDEAQDGYMFACVSEETGSLTSQVKEKMQHKPKTKE